MRWGRLSVAKSEKGWDVAAAAKARPTQAIVDVFQAEVSDFSKYQLAKAYLKWARTRGASDLADGEVAQWKTLIQKITRALK